MRVGLQTWGTEGDIRPVAALAAGLATRGHEVTLAATGSPPPEYFSVAARCGFTLHVTAVPGLEDPATQDRLAAEWIAAGHPLRQAEMILAASVDPAVELMTAAARDLCETSDLVIGHFFVHPLHALSEKAGVPMVTVHLVHTSLPSAFIRPPGFPSLGRVGHRIGWKVTQAIVNRVFLKRVNRVRTQEGLAPLDDVMTQAWISSALTLVAVSRHLCPRPPDWPSHHHVCGFIEHPWSADGGRVPDPLRGFLESGEPPVYFTFGSLMPHGAAQVQAVADIWCEAARRLGRRAILQLPVSAAVGPSADRSTLVVDRAPHAEVFPKCAAIVHHGGAGTVHAALRAGIPSVIVPHVADQFFWSAELRRLGVAARGITRKRLDARRLANALQQTLATPSFSARARDLRALLLREHGVERAVELVERVMSHPQHRQ